MWPCHPRERAELPSWVGQLPGVPAVRGWALLALVLAALAAVSPPRLLHLSPSGPRGAGPRSGQLRAAACFLETQGSGERTLLPGAPGQWGPTPGPGLRELCEAVRTPECSREAGDPQTPPRLLHGAGRGAPRAAPRWGSGDAVPGSGRVASTAGVLSFDLRHQHAARSLREAVQGPLLAEGQRACPASRSAGDGS